MPLFFWTFPMHPALIAANDLGTGVYGWCPISQNSLILISIYQREIPDIKRSNCTKLHCTVLHSKTIPEDLPGLEAVPASIRGAAVFGPEDDRKLVLLLDSPDLDAYVEEAKALGAVYDFDPYEAHITIGDIAGDEDTALNATLALLEEIQAQTPEGLSIVLESPRYSLLEK